MYGSFVVWWSSRWPSSCFYVVSKGLRAVLTQGWFTEDIPAVSRKAGGGMAPAIVGTLIITFGATLMAVPLGILGAIYLHEYGGRGRLARRHPVHGRRHDRRAVDRHGPVHLHHLHAALRA